MTRRLTALLDSLSAPVTEAPAVPLCLATGYLGPALLHLMHDPDRAHPWIRAATANGLDTGRATLFYGLPALAFVLSFAPQERYRRDRDVLAEHLSDLAYHRTRAAHRRIDRNRTTTYGEYDLISGLTGIGVALTRIDPHGTALEEVLAYLVRLTEPLSTGEGDRPGWWVHHDPRMSDEPGFPGGHMNLGMAHGISGVLSLLSINHLAGHRVPGQQDAIRQLCEALDSHKREDIHGAWWPGWVAAHGPGGHPRRLDSAGPPSWCYGTPGIARALQLAGRALRDDALKQTAEQAMLSCVGRQSFKGDDGLCHGRSGLVQALLRTAHDQATAPGAGELATAADEVRRALEQRRRAPEAAGIGLLEGRAGTALALSTAENPSVPVWDALLLLA